MEQYDEYYNKYPEPPDLSRRPSKTRIYIDTDVGLNTPLISPNLIEPQKAQHWDEAKQRYRFVFRSKNLGIKPYTTLD